MSFPVGPPTEEPQRYATDGRDAEGTLPTAAVEDSATAALAGNDPSAPGASAAETSSANLAQVDQADRDQTDREDGEKRASAPAGALGPGNTATGAGTALH
jgi:hypothetical protein